MLNPCTNALVSFFDSVSIYGQHLLEIICQVHPVLLDTPGIFPPESQSDEGLGDLRTLCMAVGLSSVTVMNFKEVCDNQYLKPFKEMMRAGLQIHMFKLYRSSHGMKVIFEQL